MNSTEHKNYRFFSKQIFLLVGFGALTLMISGMLLFFQISNNSSHRAGLVTEIDDKNITIVNAKGRTTIIELGPQTKMKVNREEIQVGKFVRAIGVFDITGVMQADGLLLLKNKPKNKK